MAIITIGGVIEGSLSYAGPRGERGETGPQGPQGEQGPQGLDGVSPTVIVEDIEGGHRITITDKDGPHTFDVMDGLIPYSGEYYANSSFSEQVFETAQKTMLDDFVVRGIVKQETSNDAGGLTLSI